MARISGINIPLNKRVEIGLTYIYGIGRSTSNRLLAQTGVEPDRKVRDLTEEEVVKLRDLIDGSLAAHFEFTIAVTADGPRVLTPWHEAGNGRAAA